MAGDTISFARGAPSADILPREAVREGGGASRWPRTGSGRSPTGPGSAIPASAEWVAERHGDLDASQVMIANGSLEAGAMLFEHLLEPGDRVIVEQPTYDRTLLLLQRLGRRAGAGAARGRRRRRRRPSKRRSRAGPVKLAHVIPNFHNPAGCTLSAEKRVRLVELAAEHGFWIFEDDPYRELPFEGDPLETMLEIDRADRVILASSFSKTVSPGVRVGYLAGPAARDREAREAGQRDLHLAEHAGRVDRPRALPLGRRSTATSSSSRAPCRRAATRSSRRSREQIPEAEFVVPGGGYFLWLDLAGGHPTPRRCSPRPRPRTSPSSPAPTS